MTYEQSLIIVALMPLLFFAAYALGKNHGRRHEKDRVTHIIVSMLRERSSKSVHRVVRSVDLDLDELMSDEEYERCT